MLDIPRHSGGIRPTPFPSAPFCATVAAVVLYSPSALAAMPRTADGKQLLISPWITPPARKDRLNSMAAQGAHTALIQSLTRWVLDRLTRRLGRAPTVLEVAQANLDAVFELVEYHADEYSDLDFYQFVEDTLAPHAGNPISPITGQPKGRGDCEDTSLLNAAMNLAVPLVGGPIMGGAVEWMPQDGMPQNHVTSIVMAPGAVFTNQIRRTDPMLPSEWAWSETTIPGARVGEHPYAAVDRLGKSTRVTGASGALFR